MSSSNAKSIHLKITVGLNDGELKVEKYGMNIDGINSEIYRLLDKPFEKRTATYSNFFLFIVTTIEEFIQKMAVFLKGIYDFDGKIFIQTKSFLEKIDSIIQSHVKQGNLDLQALAILHNDLGRLQGLSDYFLSFIQNRMDNNFNFELNVAQTFESTINHISSKIHSSYPLSLNYHLSNWLSVKWMEKKIQKEPKKFVQELSHFLKRTLKDISRINYEIGVSLAYLSFREINRMISEVFLHQVKTFNIVDISNLDNDLNSLIEIAEEDFFHLDKLKETLSQATQFIQLFLVYNPLDYMDPTKRQGKFYSLGPQFLMKVLPKYRKHVIQGLPVVRKRECKTVTDHIQEKMANHLLAG